MTTPTIKRLTEEAKKFGIVRAKGSYNGAAFWKKEGVNAIITKTQLMEILGY